MQVDPDRLDELARLLKRMNLNMEDSIPGLVDEVRRKIDEIRYNYPESSVRSALYVVEEQLNDIFARSLSIYEHLNAKEKLLRDAANQYRETERKSVALLQKAAQYTLNGLFPFLATSKGTGTSSHASTGYPVMMGWQDLLKNAVQTATAIFSEMTLDQRLAHVKEDARISGLFQQLNSGSWDEQVRAREELENIAAAFDKIARIQHEYAVYKAYGNKNYMALAHQEAQQQRNILNGLGVSELWYGPAVNLSTYYKGSPLDACRYNPLKSDYSPMPTEDELRMAIAIGWVNPLQREWAKRIYAQTEAALLKRASLSEADRLLQDAIDFYNEKQKGNEDDFHTYNVAVKMAIGVHHDDPDEVGSLAYWQQQNLTDERKKEIAYLILNSGTDEAIAGSFASLYTNYAEHQAEMNGGYGDGVGFPIFGQRRSPLEMPGAQKFTEPQEPKRPLTPGKQGELDRPKVQGEVSVDEGTFDREKLSEIQRLQEALRSRILGYNHEQGKFSYNETLGISRAEKALNKRFQPSDTLGVDMKDPGGLGNISLKGPFLNNNRQPLTTAQQEAVIKNLTKHVNNNTAVDVHIIDTLGLESNVIIALKEALKNSRVKIIYLE